MESFADSKSKLEEFQKSDNKYEFFFNSFFTLCEFPEAAEKIRDSLIQDLEAEKQQESFFTMLYDPDENKMIHKEYSTVEERNAAINNYEALIIQTTNVILREASAIKYIIENGKNPVFVPSLENIKYRDLARELYKNSAEQKIYNAFQKLGKNYEVFFNRAGLQKYPLLVNFMYDSLISEIERIKRTYKLDQIPAYNQETKKQNFWGFGSYSVRNDFLDKIIEAMNERLKELLENSKTSQPGNNDEE